MPDWVEHKLGRKPERTAGQLPLTEWGRLDLGIHVYTLAELRPLVATTPYRRAMWNRFIAFLGWPMLTNQFSYVYMGGGYPTERARPRDIDLILQTSEPYGPKVFPTLERFFRVGLETVNDIYGVHLHFWMENAPSGVCDYKTFFQYVRPLETHGPDMQGLIQISLLDPTIRSQYQEMLGGFELLDDTPPEKA